VAGRGCSRIGGRCHLNKPPQRSSIRLTLSFWLNSCADGRDFTHCRRFSTHSVIMFTFMRFGARLTFSLHVLSAVKANLLFNRAPQVTTLPSACSTVLEALSYCESVSPGFTTLDPTSQAPCLCYSSTSFVPDIFDGAVATCASGLSAEGDLADYSTVELLAGFCSSIGPVLGGGPNSASATTTTPGTLAALPTACSLVVDAISFCESVSPGFSTLNPTYQAPCLCYSSTSWDPEYFDGAVATCASGLSAQGDLADYSTVELLAGFCTSVGDVGNPPTATATPGLSPSTFGALGTSTTSGVLSTPTTSEVFGAPTSTASATSTTTLSVGSSSGAHCVSETVVCLYL
jgi:hypothetical protein